MLQNQMTYCNVSGFETLIAGLCTNYESAQGPLVRYKWALSKSGSTRVGCVAWPKAVQKKRVMKRKMK